MSTQKAITLQPQTNLSRRVPSKMETGKVSFFAPPLFTITKVLNAEINEFFNDEDEYPPITLVRKSERYHFVE